MERLLFFKDLFKNTINNFNFRIVDVFEILILAFLIYYILLWVQRTRAWVLFKGMSVIVVFLVIAYLADMYTILWIAQNIFSTVAESGGVNGQGVQRQRERTGKT